MEQSTLEVSKCSLPSQVTQPQYVLLPSPSALQKFTSLLESFIHETKTNNKSAFLTTLIRSASADCCFVSVGEQRLPYALDVAIFIFDRNWKGKEEVKGSKSFLLDVLPSMIHSLTNFQTLFPQRVPLLSQNVTGKVQFTKRQVHALLTCAFLCLFPRLSLNCTSSESNLLPSINFDEMHFAPVHPEGNSVEVAKLLMIMDYFEACSDCFGRPSAGITSAPPLPPSSLSESTSSNTQVKESTTLEGQSYSATNNDNNSCTDQEVFVTIYRHAISLVPLGPTYCNDPSLVCSSIWERMMTSTRREPPKDPNSVLNLLRCVPQEVLNNPMLPAVMHALRESIDAQTDKVRVDFANEIIGGAALSFGCVQEEIMFALCPELIVSRLVCEVMQINESIAMIGAEQFSTVRPGTYALSLAHGGKHVRGTTNPMGSVVVAIDAVDYRPFSFGANAHLLFSPLLAHRELLKCYSAFSIPYETFGVPRSIARIIATGNWGCGEFRGNPELKILIQWIACSMCKKEMHYFPFDNADLQRSFSDVQKNVLANSASCSYALTALFSTLEQLSNTPGGRNRVSVFSLFLSTLRGKETTRP